MKNKIKEIINKTPLLNTLAKKIFMPIKNFSFPGSSDYWEDRYKQGMDSGIGSYGKLAGFKAKVINGFVKEKDIYSVIEFGCGDGNQLSFFDFPSYVGLDVSKTAIKMCRSRFKKDETKKFLMYDPHDFDVDLLDCKKDLALSLDVIYHLIEDDIFQLHMDHLFSSSDRFVMIYSDDVETEQRYHVKHRRFTDWIEKNLPRWILIRKIKNPYPDISCADFYIYQKKG